MSMRTIICFGPGPRFKGGMSNYNTSLAKALDAQPGTDVHIVSWTQQYPAIVPREFIDKSSKTDFLEGTDIKVKYLTNYNRPGTWRETASYMASLKPEKVIFQWSIAIQGLPVGRIIKRLKRLLPGTEVIIDLHFVLQKEKSKIDHYFTRIGIGRADTYIVHALKTFNELEAFYPGRTFTLTGNGQRERNTGSTPVIKLYHPIYDLFKPDPGFDVEGFKKEHGLRQNVFLFFGFIRKYKGLHHAIRAFAKVAEQRSDASLLICGESFWQTLDHTKWSTRVKNALFSLAKSIFLRKADDERQYRPLELIDQLNLADRVAVFNSFIPNEDVHKYFQASDCVVLYYLTATPSGIESLSYNFGLPIVATRVGHFPETIEDGFNGYLASANDIDSMADTMLRFLDKPLPRENVQKKAAHMSWENYAAAILTS